MAVSLFLTKINNGGKILTEFNTWWSTNQHEIQNGLIMGYYNGTLILLDKALKSELLSEKDTLYFPINFLFGHYLELYLKYLIYKISGKLENGHKLHRLLQKFKNNFTTFLESNGSSEKIEELEEFFKLNLIKNIKPKNEDFSINFRYLQDKQRNLYFDTSFKGDYQKLKTEIIKINNFLNGIENFIEIANNFS